MLYAQDAEPTGFYIGGGLTQSRFDNDDFEVEDIDDEDNSWKIILGARPHRNIAIEANYVNFGEVRPALSVRRRAFPGRCRWLSQCSDWPLHQSDLMELYAKAGIARIDAKGNIGAVFFEDKATEFAYGAGIQFRFGRVGLRAEYEKCDTDVVGDLDLITAGITFNFGGS